MSDQERIACAALRHRDNGLIVCAPRHGGFMIVRVIELLGLRYDDFDQGFVTNLHDRFVTREEAWTIAEKAGQIIQRCGGDRNYLFSENIY